MRHTILTIALILLAAVSGSAQAPQPAQAGTDYVIGPQDVLVITSYDQPELTGKFAVQADGTFTYPLIGRVTVGGMTLRGAEDALKRQLVEEGLFKNPQLAVAMDQYKSQRVFIVGEVRTPGAYPMSGDMRLMEVLALAGSTLPTASGEAVVVHASNQTVLVQPSNQTGTSSLESDDESAENLVRVNLHDLANGALSQNVALKDGDTVFVLRAESVYVYGQVKNPGAYPLRQRTRRCCRRWRWPAA